MTTKAKMRQPRNWNAVAAQFRNSAGAMKTKPQSTNERDWDDISWQEDHANYEHCNPTDEK